MERDAPTPVMSSTLFLQDAVKAFNVGIVIRSYEAQPTVWQVSSAEQENAALAHYGLESISELLDHVAAKAEQLAQIDQEIQRSGLLREPPEGYVSTPEMAKQCGVGQVTVYKAIDALVEEGAMTPPEKYRQQVPGAVERYRRGSRVLEHYSLEQQAMIAARLRSRR